MGLQNTKDCLITSIHCMLTYSNSSDDEFKAYKFLVERSWYLRRETDVVDAIKLRSANRDKDDLLGMPLQTT